MPLFQRKQGYAGHRLRSVLIVAAYLFSHFAGEKSDGEQVYFAVSRDGLHWQDLDDVALFFHV